MFLLFCTTRCMGKDRMGSRLGLLQSSRKFTGNVYYPVEPAVKNQTGSYFTFFSPNLQSNMPGIFSLTLILIFSYVSIPFDIQQFSFFNQIFLKEYPISFVLLMIYMSQKPEFKRCHTLKFVFMKQNFSLQPLNWNHESIDFIKFTN